MTIQEFDPDEDRGFGEGSLFSAHLDRGWHLLDAGDASGARSSGERAHKLVPDNPDAPLLMAAVAHAEGELAEAVHWYEVAIDIDPEYPEPYLSCAQTLLYEMEQAEAALEKLDAAEELEELIPIEESEIALLRAECHFQRDQREQALRIIDGSQGINDLIEVLPERDEEHALDDSEEGDLSPVDSSIALALAQFGGLDMDELDENDVRALLRKLSFQFYRLARMLCDAGRIDSAAQILQRALSYFPQESDLWHLLGDCEFRRGEIPQAIHASFQVLELDREAPVPDWAPPPEELQERVMEVVQDLAREGKLPERLQESSLQIAVLDRPSMELIYEGLDPRSGVVALSPQLQNSTGPTLVTLAVYRINIVRFAQDEDQMQQDLVELIHDELVSHFEHPPALHSPQESHADTSDATKRSGKKRGRGASATNKKKNAAAPPMSKSNKSATSRETSELVTEDATPAPRRTKAGTNKRANAKAAKPSDPSDESK